jgi:glyoxylase-like metal-dependent hydrolase (beta-lactamase superfamily II)
MPRWLRNTLVVALALLLAGAGLWRWLTAREPVPETTSYTIDLEALHALAESLPGPKPRAIRSALVAEASMPRGAVFAGEPLAPHPQVHQVFQVLFASGYGLIDAGFPAATFEQMQALGDGQGRFHADTFDAVTRAFAGADWIVVTHEHFDHLAGASALPVEHAPRLRLNAAQLANTRALDDSEVPAALRAALEPLPDATAQALAPGVVLLAAPGHTPGSQIVYVERHDGRRALFLGDVAWHGRQIRELHYRPRLVTLLLGEDRAQVMGQLRALHTLGAAHPEVAQVVSHDAEQRAAFLADGLLLDGLEPAP